MSGNRCSWKWCSRKWLTKRFQASCGISSFMCLLKQKANKSQPHCTRPIPWFKASMDKIHSLQTAYIGIIHSLQTWASVAKSSVNAGRLGHVEERSKLTFCLLMCFHSQSKRINTNWNTLEERHLSSYFLWWWIVEKQRSISLTNKSPTALNSYTVSF